MTISKFLNPKNDIAFKHIFGSEKHKDILIHFINDIMQFDGDRQIIQVKFLSPIQDPDIAVKKQSIVDVLCEDISGVQIIVEMQVSPTKGFEKRAQYYAAKAYVRQLNKGQDGLYHNLKEIIFIAISDCIVFPNKQAYISHHVLLDKVSHERNLKDFSFSFIELPKFSIKNIEELHTIIEKWCYFFKYAEYTTEAELEIIIGSDVVIAKAYEALNQFNWTDTELLRYEEENKRIMDNKAYELYIIEEAEARGVKKSIYTVVKNMINNNMDSYTIQQCTGLSIDAIDQIKCNK